jgi:hypothetical protein
MLKKPRSIFFLLLLTIGSVSAQSTTLSCEGFLHESAGAKGAPMSATLTLGSPPSINVGNVALRTSPVSNNNIQLKFATEDFTGEYFYHTHDLFLIYKTGRLARLSCSPR